MDKIIIKEIEVFAFHGALKEENSLGQRFTIDIEMKKNIRKACEEDNLEGTVHYGYVHDDVVQLTKNTKFKLIEKLAEEIAKMVIKKYGVEEITVTFGGGAVEYAVAVHEMPNETNWTEPGTGNKYLEKPLKANSAKYLQSIAKAVEIK